MSEEYVTKRSFSVSFGETISINGFQNVRPAYSETIEITTQLIPDNFTVEEIRENFKNAARVQYFHVRAQAIHDFQTQLNVNPIVENNRR